MRHPSPASLAVLSAALFFATSSIACADAPPPPKYPALPSEMPEKFEPVTNSFDYVKRDEMIPMRARANRSLIRSRS